MKQGLKYISDDSIGLLSPELLLSLTEQIKFPLLQIARYIEGSQITGNYDPEFVKKITAYSLSLIDAYNLGIRLSLEQASTDISLVSVPAILYRTAESLKTIASHYGVTLELNIDGRHNPVLTNETGLQVSLVSLGMALIEALPSIETKQLKLHLASHRCRYGIVAGLYVDNAHFSSDTLKRGRELYGRVRQPLTDVSYSPSAGIFIADNILQSLNLKLKISHHHKLYGLGVILSPAAQLELIES